MKPPRWRTYQLVREGQDDLRYALLGHYQHNEHFMIALEALRQRNRRLLHCLVFWKQARSFNSDSPSWPDMAWSGAQQAVEVRGNYLPASGAWREGKAPHLGAYVHGIESLVQQWGLRAPWASSWLHAALLTPVYMSQFGSKVDDIVLTRQNRSYDWRAPADTSITVTLDVNEWESWDDVQDRLHTAARPQYDRIRAEVDGSGEWSRVRHKPQRAEHIGWLYERICPGERGRPKGWHSIAENAQTSHLTVRNAVLDLAAQLEIELPEIPPGRPRRFPYRPSDNSSS